MTENCQGTSRVTRCDGMRWDRTGWNRLAWLSAALPAWSQLRLARERALAAEAGLASSALPVLCSAFWPAFWPVF